MIVKNIANIITLTRLIGSLLLPFVPALSREFFIIYTYCGVTDVLDGFIARKTHTESKFGSRLDSVSDLTFYTIMMIMIMPFLREYLPQYVWVIIYITFIIRVALYSYVGITKHKLISNHTLFNKATGFFLFILPYMINTKYFIPYSTFLSLLALVAALYEIYLVFIKKRISDEKLKA